MLPAADAAQSVAFGATGDLNVPETQLVQHLFEHLTLFRRQVPPRLLFEQREDVDHLACPLEIWRLESAPRRIGDVAEMDGGGAGE